MSRCLCAIGATVSALLLAPVCLALSGADPETTNAASTVLVSNVAGVPRVEVILLPEDFKKLDAQEREALSKADALFAKACKDAPLQFRVAAPAYESFTMQYPKSLAVPYALLRQGRSMQLGKKRFEAIRIYSWILDYFPAAIPYAGAALCYIGDCHFDNGNVKEAIKAWSEMAKDVDFRKHVLAAEAMNRLADNLVLLGKWPDAVGYYEQVGADFRNSNRPAAGYAISNLLFYSIRVNPDVANVRRLYAKMESFEACPGKTDETNFWTHVMGRIHDFGDARVRTQQVARVQFYKYWADAMEGRHLEWDDYQIAVAYYRLQEEEDFKKWYARLDLQYVRGQTNGDYDRTIKWISLFANGHAPKVHAYYEKLPFDKLTDRQSVALIETLYRADGADAQQLSRVGRDTVYRFRSRMTDDAREGLARTIWLNDLDAVELLCNAMQDTNRGKMLRLKLYAEAGGASLDKGIAVSGELLQVPALTKEVHWLRGGLYRQKAKWAEAIEDYRLSEQPPASFYAMAECYVATGMYTQAVAQLTEVENFFASEAPQAALRIAYVWRDAGDSQKYIAALRAVLKKRYGGAESAKVHALLQAQR